MKIISTTPILQMRNIHVIYDEIKALNGVDFDLYRGEIHALIGEHRAGKSSLVKLLSGAIRKKEGEIIYYGKKINHFTPKSAIKNGIGMIYQNLNIIPEINVVENIFSGNMITNHFGFINYKEMVNLTQRHFDQLEIDINLKTPLFKLSLAEQHMVELAKVLIMNPDVIIFDEISSKLTPYEMKSTYQLIFDYKKRNKSIIYISHDMDEILNLADRVTVLKNGYRRDTEPVKDLDKFTLFQLTYSFALDKKKLEGTDTKIILLKHYIENIIHNLPVGIMIFDLKNNLQIMNYTIVEILNISPNVLKNKSISLILDKINIENEIKSQIITKINNREEYCFDNIYMNNEKVIKLNISQYKDDNGIFLGTTVIIQDISMDKYLQDYLMQSEKLASVAEVAVGVAHEINNPIFIIQNYVELIKEKTRDKYKQEKLLKIEKELGRIEEIISSLLSFSSLKSIPKEKVNLANLVEDVLLLLQHKISKKEIVIKKEIRDGEIEIYGNENKLKQLFINLINNSIEAMLDNGFINIGLLSCLPDEYVEINITDNGYGIPDDVKEDIFKPFFSTKLNKKNTGLGLSICQHIVEEHGGIISFISTPGKNTKFTIRFPLNAL